MECYEQLSMTQNGDQGSSVMKQLPATHANCDKHVHNRHKTGVQDRRVFYRSVNTSCNFLRPRT